MNIKPNNINICKQRRTNLINAIKKNNSKDGSIFLFANTTAEQLKFIQESSFYYFSGINEPACVLQINLDGSTRLFVPNTNNMRARWLQETIDTTNADAQKIGVDEIVYLGDPIGGYQFAPLFQESSCRNLINILKDIIATNKTIFTCIPTGSLYTQQYLWLTQLARFVPELPQQLTNINAPITTLRRQKDQTEIEKIFYAMQATVATHAEIVSSIEPGAEEFAIQAQIALTIAAFTMNCAFAPIVAAGRNSVLPHYEKNTGTLTAGDVVLIDCGAQYEHYCADLTRTYPVNGTFTSQQQKIYECVLACQQELVEFAKPGVFLNNKDIPEQSLYHRMLAFFEKHGYKDFVVHGVGHFLGLDVHDVGDANTQLQEGDVITIEPGLYLPHENFGIRIEDDYWVIKDGLHCLSEELPKTPKDLHTFLTQKEKCESGCSHTH